MDSFCDLCVPDSSETLPILEQLFQFGCHLVAIERSVDLDAQPVPSLKDKRQQREAMRDLLKPPDLAPLASSSALGRYAAVHGSKAKILSRVTLRASKAEDMANFCKLFAAELATFDVVAACPLTEAAFNFACDQMPSVDLVQLDCWQRPAFRANHLVRRAMQRGVHFELLMAPMLASAPCRGYTVSMAHSFMQVTRGKTFVFSSGARSPWDVRNGVGLACVAAMLGVPGPQAARCLREAPRAVVLHALVRNRTAFGAFAIQKLEGQRGVKAVTVVKAAGDVSTAAAVATIGESDGDVSAAAIGQSGDVSASAVGRGSEVKTAKKRKTFINLDACDTEESKVKKHKKRKKKKESVS